MFDYLYTLLNKLIIRYSIPLGISHINQICQICLSAETNTFGPLIYFILFSLMPSTYWVPQKLPPIYTVIAYTFIGKVA